ncbi:P pilus assembly protein%2C pilin FimA [Enterobacter cloacae]|nr:P pilus assembly protein%2C pilin FimA [Enterobacter cloacae]
MMMKKRILMLAVLAATLITQTRADDIQLQMTGNIFANTCVVDSASRNLTVDLGQAASSDFRDVGDTGAWKTFSLKVTHCPKSLAVANAAFYGQPDGAHPTKFANTGSAKGLALELADGQDHILIAPQASFNAVIDQNDHTATFPLAARYYATSMPVTAGTFSSVVQVTFTYQ